MKDEGLWLKMLCLIYIFYWIFFVRLYWMDGKTCKKSDIEIWLADLSGTLSVTEKGQLNFSSTVSVEL